MNSSVMIQTRAKERRSFSFEKTVYGTALFLSGLISLYLITVMVSGKNWLPFIPAFTDSGALSLPLVACLLCTAALHIPALLRKFTKINIPQALSVVFYLFVFCATVLGEVFDFYYRVPHWDDVLHLSSGIMIGLTAGILLTYVMKEKKIPTSAPLLIAIGVFCCAVSVGVIWEVYEFVADYLLGFNMQKFMLQDGTALSGQFALMDTMKDLIADSCGAGIAAVITHFAVKRKMGWLYSYESQPNNAVALPVKDHYEPEPLRRIA